MTVLVAILGLAVLMIVHEGGHYLAARASGLRVLKFSIGFGPTFFKILPDGGYWCFSAFGGRIKTRLFAHDPEKHGPTVFQVAMIPFLAYVQIAGMNPLEDNDPNDKGSYANASLRARVATIFAGPLANYLFASVFFFVAFNWDGVPADTTHVEVMDGRPAAAAGMQTRDRVLSIDGKEIENWKQLSEQISTRGGQEIEVVVERQGERVPIRVTPETNDEGRGLIGVRQRGSRPAAGVGEAASLAIKEPPRIVQVQLTELGKWARGKSQGELGGPKAMVDHMATAVKTGWGEFVFLLGALSAWLAAFNLLPFPALDGGRLMFLGYEAATRRRANPTVEAQIHAVGMLMLLGVMIYVTLANDFKLAK